MAASKCEHLQKGRVANAHDRERLNIFFCNFRNESMYAGTYMLEVGRTCRGGIRATLSIGFRIACNMFAWPCRSLERQTRLKSHQVMTRSVATSALAIVVLSIGSMKRGDAFTHIGSLSLCSSHEREERTPQRRSMDFRTEAASPQ